eukprot:1158776-Pelagomonas_calceolata.AAC.3
MSALFMICFVLQFSASTVIHTLQCFKKGNRRCSLRQLPRNRKGRAMNRQRLQRKNHPVMISRLFVCVLTNLCQVINVPHTLQPFSQINNILPHDYRLLRMNMGCTCLSPPYSTVKPNCAEPRKIPAVQTIRGGSLHPKNTLQ